MTHGVCSGAATTARGMIPGHPAVGSRNGPWGPAPTKKGTRVLLHHGVCSPPISSVYAIGGSTRGSGKRAEAQGVVSRGMAQPNPKLEASARNIHTVC